MWTFFSQGLWEICYEVWQRLVSLSLSLFPLPPQDKFKLHFPGSWVWPLSWVLANGMWAEETPTTPRPTWLIKTFHMIFSSSGWLGWRWQIVQWWSCFEDGKPSRQKVSRPPNCHVEEGSPTINIYFWTITGARSKLLLSWIRDFFFFLSLKLILP